MLCFFIFYEVLLLVFLSIFLYPSTTQQYTENRFVFSGRACRPSEINDSQRLENTKCQILTFCQLWVIALIKRKTAGYKRLKMSLHSFQTILRNVCEKKVIFVP